MSKAEEKTLAAINQMVDDGVLTREVAERYFPEYAESEDERVRKGIIRCIKGNMPDNDSRKKYLAWLEKQGEKKSVEWSEEDNNMLSDIDACIADFPIFFEKMKINGKEVLNSDFIPKARKFLKSLKDRTCPKLKQEWGEDDEEHLNSIIASVRTDMSTYPRSEEVKDLFISDISWLKSLKNRYVPQSKQEWNYNDERIIETIIQEIEKIPSEKFIDNAKDRCLNWLRYRTKSIKPQKRWNPSDEQMKELARAKDSCFDLSFETKRILNSLYKDLKKLKEE